MPRQIQLAALRRRGMTLIELLVVVTIVVTLMALVVTSIRPSLENRKSRESARVVTAVIARAKARAAELDRPVGIWLQRGEVPIADDTIPGGQSYNFATQIFLAETPPPYAGDDITSTALLVDFNGDGVADGARFDIPLNSRLYSTDTAIDSLVKVGDFIRFSYRGGVYPVTQLWSGVSGGTPYYFMVFGWFPGPDLKWGVANNDDNSNMVDDDVSEIGYPGSDDFWRALAPAPMPVGGRVPYQVYRRPERSGEPVELPGGSAIDFSNSGTGLSGVEFRSDNQTAVVIMFGPSGKVTSVNYGNSAGVAAAIPDESIHLLVGKMDQFILDDASPLPFDSSASPPQIPFNKNLTDRNSLWISIAPRTGNVTTAKSFWGSDSTSIGAQAGQTVVNLTYFATHLAETRQAAQEGRTEE